MKIVRIHMVMIVSVGSVLCLFFSAYAGVPQWYEFYKNGLEAMEQGDWNQALKNFQGALKIKNRDQKKVRAFGTVFIQYFPHREIGVCYYHLGHIKHAEQELSLSLQQTPSKRARFFLNRIKRGEYPAEISAPSSKGIEKPQEDLTQTPTIEPTSEAEPATIMGERLSIAVLPFESKGIGEEIGQVDLLDKLITGFVNIKRFKVIERAQLEKILDEQKLGMSGIVDAATAAEIGKGIGLDAVIVGSVTQAGNSVSIDARLIDTETATIITSKDAYSNRISLKDISQMISELAEKIKSDLPIVSGYVINIDGKKLTLDIGRKNAIKKGMKCHVYREGESIVHPVSEEVIGKMIEELCEVQIIDVFDAYSIAVITKPKSGTPQKLDKVITK
jgi:TolB-like protein